MSLTLFRRSGCLNGSLLCQSKRYKRVRAFRNLDPEFLKPTKEDEFGWDSLVQHAKWQRMRAKDRPDKKLWKDYAPRNFRWFASLPSELHHGVGCLKGDSRPGLNVAPGDIVPASTGLAYLKKLDVYPGSNVAARFIAANLNKGSRLIELYSLVRGEVLFSIENIDVDNDEGTAHAQQPPSAFSGYDDNEAALASMSSGAMSNKKLFLHVVPTPSDSSTPKFKLTHCI